MGVLKKWIIAIEFTNKIINFLWQILRWLNIGLYLEIHEEHSALWACHRPDIVPELLLCTERRVKWFFEEILNEFDEHFVFNGTVLKLEDGIDVGVWFCFL